MTMDNTNILEIREIYLFFFLMKRAVKTQAVKKKKDLILTKECADVDSIKYKYMWDNILI